VSKVLLESNDTQLSLQRHEISGHECTLCSGSVLHILPLTLQDNLAYHEGMYAYAANSRSPGVPNCAKVCWRSVAVLTRCACLMIPARMQNGLKCEKHAMVCNHANIRRGHSIIRIYVDRTLLVLTWCLLRKEKTTPFGVNINKSQISYRAAQMVLISVDYLNSASLSTKLTHIQKANITNTL